MRWALAWSFYDDVQVPVSSLILVRSQPSVSEEGPDEL